MFFGRRKHAAPAPAAVPATPVADAAQTAPRLSDELIFAAVQHTLNEVFGEAGEWTVARRSEDQDDMIFHEVLVHSLATSVTASVAAARESLGVGEEAEASHAEVIPIGGPLGLLRAPRTEVPTVDPELVAAEQQEDEPAVLSWEPAPITRWADLKRPVTGPVAVVEGSSDTAVDKDKAA